MRISYILLFLITIWTLADHCLASMIDNCALIKVVDTGAICVRCEDHFYLALKNTRCYNCDSNCFSCNVTALNCTECYPGMSLDLMKNTCFSCINNCKTCSDRNSCDVCNSFFYAEDGKVCKRCMDHCEVCKDRSSCLRCEEGYTHAKHKEACTPNQKQFVMLMIVCLVAAGIVLGVPVVLWTYKKMKGGEKEEKEGGENEVKDEGVEDGGYVAQSN